MKTVKIIRSGDKQTIELPEEFHFDGDEVSIRKSSNGLEICPIRTKRSWDALEASLNEFTDDFFIVEPEELEFEERDFGLAFKTISRLQDKLSLSEDDLTKILGIDTKALRRITEIGFISDSKTVKTAKLMLNFFQMLGARMGNDEHAMQHWLKSNNKDFGMPPLALIKTEGGIAEVTRYLAAFSDRGA